jgi:hypothetical protein
MMCHRIGRPPMSIMGLGRDPVSSAIRVPRPPARITHFIYTTPCIDRADMSGGSAIGPIASRATYAPRKSGEV